MLAINLDLVLFGHRVGVILGRLTPAFTGRRRTTWNWQYRVDRRSGATHCYAAIGYKYSDRKPATVAIFSVTPPRAFRLRMVSQALLMTD